IIQHGEVDFRDSRRDHTRGRIWRVTAKGRPTVPRPKLVGAATGDLLKALESPEAWTRVQARRVLQERGASAVAPELAVWTGAIDRKRPDAEALRLEALWTFEAIGRPEPSLLRELLHSPEPRIRAAAVRVVPHWKDGLDDAVALLGERTSDDFPRVRLEAVRALAEYPELKAAELAMAALDRPVDSFLDYALWLTARQLAPKWLPEARAGRFDFGGKPGHLVYALLAVNSPEVVPPLLTLLREGKVPKDQDGRVQNLIATQGGPAELGAVLDLVLGAKTLPPSRRAALLDLLASAAARRKVVPAGDLSRIVPLIADRDDATRAAALRAAGAWKVPAIDGRLADLAGAADTPDSVRAAAIEAMARRGKPEGRRAIENLADRGTSAGVQAMALAALEEIDPNVASPRIADWLRRLPVDRAGEAAPVLARVLGRRDGPLILARAIDQKASVIPTDLAKLLIRQVRSAGRDEPALVAALSKAGGLNAAPKALSPPEMASLLAEVAQNGDPARGEQVFRRRDLTCLNCHAIAGAGGQVGPSLESIGASAQPDYLVDSILQPNKQVKENYHAITVATDDGKIYTGIKRRQTDSELVLRDSEDREVSIPLASVDAQKMAGSIMPAGLADGLTHSELVDLVRFLSVLGKAGPYAVGTGRACRRWQVLELTRPVRQRLARSGVEGLLRDDGGLTWRPAYATVAGFLPASEWREGSRPVGGSAQGIVGLARTQIHATTAGPVRLALDATDGLTFYLDGRRVEPKAKALTLDLSPGRHTLAVAIGAVRTDGVRCVLEDIPGSPARASVVLGK
ncbi:MAG: HEAT repeat domain-containing protein, partial [Isosphaeraceae bacterium]